MWKAFMSHNKSWQRLGIVLLFVGGAATATDNIEVRGDAAAYSADGKRAEFTGNVIIKTADMNVSAQQLIVSVRADGNHYRIYGTPVRATCNTCDAVSLYLTAPDMQWRDDAKSLSLNGGFLLCAGAATTCPQGQLRGDNAHWQLAENIIALSGTPVNGVWHNDGGMITLRANHILYHHGSGEISLRGDARIARDNEEIYGETIKINIKTGAIAADGGGDSGRVRGVFGVNE